MKYLKLNSTILLFSVLLLTTQSYAENNKPAVSTTVTSTHDKELANSLIERLNEINTMDKSELNSKDKKELRKEVRTIKSQLNQLGEGVYLSVGAIIIIILLLILLA